MHHGFTELRRRLDGRSPRRNIPEDHGQAAVALVMVPGDSAADLDLLLIKRAARRRDPWSGQMALPGGRRELRDADLMATAIRETQEETGVILPPTSLLGELDDLVPSTRHLPSLIVRPFVFGLETRPAIVPSVAEVALHLWIPLQQLRESRGTAKVDARGARLTVDAFLIDEHVVWGMTERILKPFIDLAE